MKALSLNQMPDIHIRQAQLSDYAQALVLMKKLAEIEGYSTQFAVTLPSLARAIEQQSIGLLVAEVDEKVEGILVYFFQPFTYDLSPWLIIKELYVSEHCRGLGLGNRLFQKARQVCHSNGGKKMKWEVLSNNIDAQKFYSNHGATMLQDWRLMSIDFS